MAPQLPAKHASKPRQLTKKSRKSVRLHSQTRLARRCIQMYGGLLPFLAWAGGGIMLHLLRTDSEETVRMLTVWICECGKAGSHSATLDSDGSTRLEPL